MRLVTFKPKNAKTDSGDIRLGAIWINEEKIIDFTSALIEGEINSKSFLEWIDLDGKWFPKIQDFYKKCLDNETEAENHLLSFNQIDLLAPIPRPGKVICIGLNYRDHAIESNMAIPERPIVFSKFPTSVIGDSQPVILPTNSEKTDYEAELAVVIGRRAKNVSVESAFDYVLGYTNLNDLSERGFQFADGQWQRGKSCDTFAPIGKFIATKDEIPDPHNLSIKFRLNGETLQDSNTSQMIFDIPTLISFLSETITLEPGDIIATGTPPGVGFARNPPVFLKKGDVMEVEVEGLGILRNPVN